MDDTLSLEFGKQLRRLRESMSLTQEESAYRCKIQASHISQLERGEKNPTLDTLYKIANGYHITVPQLLSFAEDMAESPYDDITNKIIARLEKLNRTQKKKILSIIKILSEPDQDESQ